MTFSLTIDTLRNGNINPAAHDAQIWGNIPSSDRFTFIYFPIFAGFLIGLFFPLTKELVNVYATIMSIFAGFLFNLLVICIDRQKAIQELKGKPYTDAKRVNHALKILPELFSNISFLILLSVFILLFVIVIYFIPEDVNIICLKIFHAGLSSAVYIFFIIFVLTLLLVLKRTYNITQAFLDYSPEISPKKIIYKQQS